MKRRIFILVLVLALSNVCDMVAQEIKEAIPEVSVTHFGMERNGKYLSVELSLDLTSLNVETNRVVLLTPRLVNGVDSLDLPSVGIYGRKRYYYYVRNGIDGISGPDEIIFRAANKPDNIEYNQSVLFKEWMDGAELEFHRMDWGCCHEKLIGSDVRLGRHHEAFFPELVFIQPEAELVKSRSLSGSAFIDFPVNKVEIYSEYRRNTAELSKIEATIDSVRSDKDISIVSVYLKGYASPESPYSHNRDLAVGRTKSLKEYIQRLYNFDENVIVTDYEPEDWEGLKRYVENSNINHRAEILQLIDGNLDPDVKEAKIKRTYPTEYNFLLQHCYPALRHTDYRIDYNIRSYNSVDEIKRILLERPQNLGLNEFYFVAGAYEPGTVEFTEVFETAVRMFPNDEVANLNAANAAIRCGNHEAARRYLDKAGNSAEAVYARGALAVREKEYQTAALLFAKAGDMGLEKGAATLKELKERGYIQ